MVTKANRRPTQPSDRGRTCPGCGWPIDECRCSGTFEEPIPKRVTAVLRIEKKGRGGKTVTVISGLPRNTAFIRTLARDLKRSLGTGGSHGTDHIEIQGDHREFLRALLASSGIVVKG